MQAGSRRPTSGWLDFLCRFALAFAFAFGVAAGRNRVETEAETLGEAVDGDAETHKRDEQRATRHRATRLLASSGRGVAIFATPLRMAPTRCEPSIRARGVPRRSNPDDDDDERMIG